jgi:nitroreductase
MVQRACQFYQQLKRRRSVRSFSSQPIPEGVLEDCLRAAGTAPSGANQQPWHFAVVTHPGLKRRIRQAAEQEEHAFYHGRAPQEWLDALEPLGTNEHKPFLEEAPALIGIFARSLDLDPHGEKRKNYYVSESVGIATGMLITALHHCGLCCLTHTPSPMGFLRELLGRPPHERPFLLLVVGFPAEGVQVPVLEKLPLESITSFHT